ncbi:MAG: dipeptide ABC transporter ATP-binding protein [Gaiella sp.]
MSREATAQTATTGAVEGNSVLSIDELVVEFPVGHRTVRAVDGLSFTIRPGQKLGVVGESGSGKSTVAMAVLGLLESPGRIEGGSITLGGLELNGATDDVLRTIRGGRIAMIFQDALGSLNPVKTIGYQLVEAIRLHTDATKAGAADRAVELLAEVGVQSPRQRLEQYPHEFSGGMRQRVMIAMALASNPELLIADEPTTALDVTTQASVIDLLHRLSDERQMAVMLITHDLGIIASFAEDVLVMYAGAPVEFGSVDDVFARAGHPYTQALIAAVPQLDDARAESLPSIPGVLPRADAIPPGCRFAPRCRLAAGREICLSERPAFDMADPVRRVACHFVDESRATVGVVHRQEISLGQPSLGETLLVVGDLAKDYRARGASGPRKRWLRAVESVSFEIRRGESLGLVGESGSGKSTVARLLLGLTPRTRGEVAFEGRPLEASSGGIAKEQRGRVQMVFQDPGDSLDPLMTIEQIVAEPLLLLHRRDGKKHRGRVPELLELVGLEADYGKRRPLQLSGGQRQRVAIARALATDPALIVCDEAVSSLDVSVRAQILNLLMDLQRRLGLSYLFISHDLSTVRHVCDRVAVMYGGRFVEVADADRIFSAPQHPYTMALLSAVPIADPARERERERIRLQGELPDLTEPVPGCIFASRCWKAQERCTAERPELTERAGATHLSACHFPENAG